MRIISLLVLASFAVAKPTVYMIRHGAKPDDGNGLSQEGERRAQCLRSVFGSGSGYDIGHIMAQTPKSSKRERLFATLSEYCQETMRHKQKALTIWLSDGKRKRPYDTVKPLADDLGLEVDVSCDRDDSDCVVDFIKHYSGDGNILLW